MLTLDRQTAFTQLLAFEAAHTRRSGLIRSERYARAWEYFTGANAPPDNTDQPLGINLFAATCRKHAGYVWGQWEKQVVQLRLLPDDPQDDAEKRACEQASRLVNRLLFRENAGNLVLIDGALNQAIYGDCYLRLDWDTLANDGQGGVTFTQIPPEYVHLRWHPNDVNRIIEAIIAYPIDRHDARKYVGSAGSPRLGFFTKDQEGTGMYWERWTPETLQIWVDLQQVSEEPNPLGAVDPQTGQALPGPIPIIPVPNLRGGGDPFGFGDAETVMQLQDELNRKLSDEGDIIDNHAHPITILRKYFGETDELTVGPDEVWNLGREGEAEYLEWKGPAPMTHEYLQLIMDLFHDLSSLPPAAFGRAQQSQLSGIAAQMALMPLTERASIKRVNWNEAFRQLIRVLGRILINKAAPLDGALLTLFKTNDVQPVWFPILPKDREAQVDEAIARFSSGLHTTETALQAVDEEDAVSLATAIKTERKLLALDGILPTGGPAGGGKKTGMAPAGSSATPSTPSR